MSYVKIKFLTKYAQFLRLRGVYNFVVPSTPVSDQESPSLLLLRLESLSLLVLSLVNLWGLRNISLYESLGIDFFETLFYLY